MAEPSQAYIADATAQWRGIPGSADAVVCPESTADVELLLRFCQRHDVPVTPRGGGTGLAGGAIPLEGGVVLALERLRTVRSFEPEHWRIQLEAGLRTSEIHRLARENGLMYAPDPGSSEQSQIGGNIATNAGGPHTFKYGTTRAWVTGLEAVLAGGERIELGGPTRKDVAGYDLLGLLVGSEGTLAVITAAWLKLLPAPETQLPLVAIYPDTQTGAAAVERLMACGLQVATLDYIDGGTLAVTGAAFPVRLPPDAGFMLIAEADGSAAEAARLAGEAREALADDLLALHAPTARHDIDALWRWRDGVANQVAGVRGGKVSEDIAVPPGNLADAITETVAIAERHGLHGLSWGHAGDGNLHSTFLVDPADPAEVARAEAAAQELFAFAIARGGTISGEHGVGAVKRGQLARQWAPAALELHDAVKRAFDPQGILNRGKKPGRLVASA
ncbi:MAG: FAD-linked oxidase C-terminal domain-containing protein [Solirubrobacteraceae bacterium]